jgi:hypothetical protein
MYQIIDGTTTRVYEGIYDISLKEASENPALLLVVAWFDGEPDLWLVDNTGAALEELKRYYRDDWGDRDVPMTVYQRVKA